ncbi:MAG TPA: VOC family protein [Limnobacter sp.]|nr:VOC family protein [Limnobacter sp.]
MTTLSTAHPVRSLAPLVKAKRLAYLMWERPNLNKAEAFLNDFGLHTAFKTNDVLHMRGTASAPFCYMVKKSREARFIGFGLEVEKLEDLNTLATTFNVAVQTQIKPATGHFIELTDPAGFTVHVAHGLTDLPELTTRQAMPHNTAAETPRINKTQRSNPHADVIRLGHVVLEVANYQEVSAWYTNTFGLIPSDIQVLPDGSPAVTFFRLNLGQTPTDHHTLALAQGFMATYSHAAFEVMDADAVGMGQRALRERGYKHAWGIGRHILGSQIFDYWNDPWMSKHEHYCDGDVFTEEHPTGIHPVNREAMAQWGQPMPSSFTKPKMTPQAIAALSKNLKTAPDLTVKKLITLAKIFA